MVASFRISVLLLINKHIRYFYSALNGYNNDVMFSLLLRKYRTVYVYIPEVLLATNTQIFLVHAYIPPSKLHVQVFVCMYQYIYLFSTYMHGICIHE